MLRAIVTITLVLAAGRGCNDDAVEPETEEEIPAGPEVYSSPYDLADAALEAYRGQDAGAWEKLTGTPPDEGTFVKAGILGAGDAIVGLYFIDEGDTIAAVARKSTAMSTGIWFRIERAAGGFVLVGVVVSDENVPTDVPVEG